MELKWNAGGWFGSQLGATAWILVAGVLTAFHDTSNGLIVVAVFFGANLIGYLLWHSRKFSCYASTQFLIAIAGVAGLLAIRVLEHSGQWAEIQYGGEVSAGSSYLLVIAVVAILMVTFYLRFGRK